MKLAVAVLEQSAKRVVDTVGEKGGNGNFWKRRIIVKEKHTTKDEPNPALFR